jgi:phosphoglycerate-specific signal transduction histidine kinase
VTHDTWIEQSRRFEGIFVQEVRADEAALVLCESSVSREGIFHLSRARLESLQQVAMATQEIFEHLGQLTGDRRRIQRQNAFDNMVRACLVCRIQVARLSRRLEWTHNDPSRIGTQVECMPVEERAV